MEEEDVAESIRPTESIVIIMAGGLGKRMNSDIPKVLHRIRGLPMIVSVILSVKQLSIPVKKILIVVGKYRPQIEQTLFKYVDSHFIQFIDQYQPLGTGHAIQCCRDELLLHPPDTKVLILSGDVPLLHPHTMENMLDTLRNVTVLTTRLERPTGYGRVLLDSSGIFLRIVEEKDATEAERAVQIINGGIYAVKCGLLCRYLPMIQNKNEQCEYYLTDIVEIIREHEGVVDVLDIGDMNQRQILGVNTPEDLAYVNSICRKRL